MKTMKKILARSYYAFFMALLLSQAAFAYLDPGTVTYVVSMVAALFIAGGTALAIFRRKIKLFFQNLGKKKNDSTAAAIAEDEDEVINPMEVNPMDEDKE
ncbi:MAG: hypothetical protein PUC06_03930 [Oscillospiraceae bacterium]|nr:hypothetical protein [Oscillospiraceae bacterium]